MLQIENKDPPKLKINLTENKPQKPFFNKLAQTRGFTVLIRANNSDCETILCHLEAQHYHFLVIVNARNIQDRT